MPAKNGRPFRPTLLSLEDRTTPSAGILDPTFGVGGRVTTRFSAPSVDVGRASAVDSLGRIVVAGYSDNGSNHDFAISRYTAAGVLDASFGGTGIVTIAFGLSDDVAYGVAVDSLDRVVVAGSTRFGSTDDFAVARLTTAGALDTSFDGDGKQTIAFGTADDVAYGVAVDSLNRVVIAGSALNGSTDDFAVARLTAVGALDGSFDGDGKQTIAFGAADDDAYAVAVDSLDRVVVAGFTFNGSNADFAVARLAAGGALDTVFDGDGKQTIDFGAATDLAYGVAVDSLNRVVVAGSAYNGSNDDFAVARLTAAGALDASFDGDGRQTIDFGAAEDVAYGVAVDSLDRVVAAGSTYSGSYDFFVARLTSAGALDASFDGDGKQTIAFGAAEDVAYSVAVDSLDRVVVAGRTNNGSNYDFAVARLTAAGALDASFDGDGKQTTELLASSNAGGTSIAVDSMGRTVVAGYSDNGSNHDFAISRYTAAGVLDTSFGGTGIVTIAFGAVTDDAYAVAVDSLDRVVVAGSTLIGPTDNFAVARLTAAGALDTSFDGDGKQTIAFSAAEDVAYGVAVDSLNRVVVAAPQAHIRISFSPWLG